jgi:hypothetical protein
MKPSRVWNPHVLSAGHMLSRLLPIHPLHWQFSSTTQPGTCPGGMAAWALPILFALCLTKTLADQDRPLEIIPWIRKNGGEVLI